MTTEAIGDREIASRAVEALRRPRVLPWALAALMAAAGIGLRAAGSLPVLAFFAISLLAGLVAAYAVVRARYDASVFQAWAAADDLPAAVARFDARWSRGSPAACRPMADRVAGALRWKRRGLLAANVQGLCAFAGFWPLRHLLD